MEFKRIVEEKGAQRDPGLNADVYGNRTELRHDQREPQHVVSQQFMDND